MVRAQDKNVEHVEVERKVLQAALDGLQENQALQKQIDQVCST